MAAELGAFLNVHDVDIMHRLNEMPDFQRSTNNLAERLRSLELKIDQVIDAVTQNNTQQ